MELSGIKKRGGEIAANVAKSWENQWFVKTGGSYRKTGDQHVPHHTLQNTGMEFNSLISHSENILFLQGFLMFHTVESGIRSSGFMRCTFVEPRRFL
ncbi:hypothetical protein [Chryseobacterium indoltheticum]|uniref:hypothetical protein n=1 Tax=Chryseobacterium indoltheticum TaxID=254 RepID=UPI003F496734